MKTPPRATGAAVSLCALAFVAALSGCAGGDDTAGTLPVPPASAPVAAPAAAASTTVSGRIVKGPVSGAQRCAYTVVVNARGAALNELR